MNRRTFIKQSAVVTVGIATGATLPVVASGFPGVMGVDVAKPGSDQTIIFLGYSDQLKTHIWKLTPPNTLAVNHIQSILDEADKRQTPWGRVMSDVAVAELTKEEEG